MRGERAAADGKKGAVARSDSSTIPGQEDFLAGWIPWEMFTCGSPFDDSRGIMPYFFATSEARF